MYFRKFKISFTILDKVYFFSYMAMKTIKFKKKITKESMKKINFKNITKFDNESKKDIFESHDQLCELKDCICNCYFCKNDSFRCELKKYISLDHFEEIEWYYTIKEYECQKCKKITKKHSNNKELTDKRHQFCYNCRSECESFKKMIEYESIDLKTNRKSIQNFIYNLPIIKDEFIQNYGEFEGSTLYFYYLLREGLIITKYVVNLKINH